MVKVLTESKAHQPDIQRVINTYFFNFKRGLKQLKKIIISIIAVLALVHSINTIIYNLPSNPVQQSHTKFINFYMQPLFEQTWTLFAPLPINTNNTLNVRYGNNRYELIDDGWKNLTKYYQADFRKHYLHKNFYKNTIVTQMESDILELIDLKNTGKISDKELKNDEKIKALYNFVLKELNNNSIYPKYMQLSYEIEYLPPFENRNTKKREFQVEKSPITNTRELE